MGGKVYLARAALQFVLGHEVVACVIPGFRNQRQVEVNLTAAGKPLSQADLEYIREVFAE